MLTIIHNVRHIETQKWMWYTSRNVSIDEGVEHWPLSRAGSYPNAEGVKSGVANPAPTKMISSIRMLSPTSEEVDQASPRTHVPWPFIFSNEHS